jgi:hypothetical protein
MSQDWKTSRFCLVKGSIEEPLLSNSLLGVVLNDPWQDGVPTGSIISLSPLFAVTFRRETSGAWRYDVVSMLRCTNHPEEASSCSWGKNQLHNYIVLRIGLKWLPRVWRMTYPLHVNNNLQQYVCSIFKFLCVFNTIVCGLFASEEFKRELFLT